MDVCAAPDEYVHSVWCARTQLVIKGFDVSVNLQNAIMYAFGSLIATAFFIHSRSTDPGHI